jgi:LmbE family N-acetylglucosaminyl deacetylase
LSVHDLASAERVLCVQPHYDDNDLGAGGTITALAAGGATVAYLTVTDDLVGVLDETLSDAEATERLRAEQHQAGEAVGVAEQRWLGLPDAGEWDYFELRRGIIAELRRFRPDVVFTVDPWLPYEAHQDHLRVGRAVAEASFLQRMKRLRVDPEPDADWEPHEIAAVVFYFTREPNLCFDISASRERKHRAIDAYRAQFTEEQLRLLHLGLDAKEREWAEAEPFSHGEALKVLAPGAFHVGL